MPHPRHLISGYVAKTEMRYTPQGLAIFSFSIPEKVWSKSERQGYKPAYSGNGFECTAWNNITVFGDLAESVSKWLEKKAFVECVVKPNGQVENGYMTPKTYKERTSYDWIASEVRPVGNEQESYETEPPDFVEDDQVPF